jgi:chromosome segregation ATPase
MSASDKALQDMKDRRLWSYISEHHSQGSMYRALQKFEPHMEKLYSELCERVSNIEDELKVANDNIQEAKESQEKIETKNNDLRKERDQISTEILEIENRRNEVMSDLLTKTADLDDLNMKLDELSQRHITVDARAKMAGHKDESLSGTVAN